MSKINKKSLLIFIFIPIFIFFLAFSFYSSIYKDIPITYWDEDFWIGRSYFFELLLKKDFNNSLWLSYFSYDQPKLAEYMYGAVLYPYYLKLKKEKKYKEFIQFLIDHNFYEEELDNYPQYQQYKNNNKNFVDWSKVYNPDFHVTTTSLRKKIGPKIEKTIDLLLKARKINIYILSINIVIVYFLTYFLTNSLLISLITSFFYGNNYLIIDASLKAHSDGLFTLLFNISLLFLILYFKNKNHPIKYAIFFAISVALLNSTKINGVMLIIIFNLLLLFDFLKKYLYKKRENLFKIILNFLLVSFIFLNLFILHHPFLIKNPIKNTLFLYEHRKITGLQQSEEFKEYKLKTKKERLLTIWRNFLGKAANHYSSYKFIENFIEKKPRIYSMIIKILFIVGFILFLFQRGKKFWFFITTFFLVQIIMSFYLFLNWDRYFIHLVFFFCLFPLYSLKILEELFYRLLKSYKLFFPKKKI